MDMDPLNTFGKSFGYEACSNRVLPYSDQLTYWQNLLPSNTLLFLCATLIDLPYRDLS